VVFLGGFSTVVMIVFLHRYALWAGWDEYLSKEDFGVMIYDFLCHQG
jgi:hypothetical protein